MNKKLIFAIAALLTFASCSIAGKTSEQQWTNLIQDQSLSNWLNVYKDGEATVHGNEIHLKAKNNWFFLTQKRYSDFIFETEILMPNVTEYSNSGIIFRGQTRKKKDGSTEAFGYQAECDPSSRAWSGGLYDQGRRQWLHPKHKSRSNYDEKFIKNLSPGWSEKRKALFKKGQWNKYRIECRGQEIKIFYNGVLTTHVLDSTDSEGHIGIQHHGSKELIATGKTTNIVKFRNLRIKELAKSAK